MSLPRILGLEGALARRDASVKAHQALLVLWEQDRPAYFEELKRFFACHCTSMASKAEELHAAVDQGPRAWAHATGERLRTLPCLTETGSDVFFHKQGSEEALGMCGVLRPMLRLDLLAGDANPATR